jgi:hypothetical protein
LNYKPLALAPLLFPLLCVLSNCSGYGRGFGALDTVACPELGGSADALAAQYTANARANAKIRTFVQAAKDLAGISLQIENRRPRLVGMAVDIGMTAELQPRNEPGGNASGAAVLRQLDTLFRGGIAVRAFATPPQCQINAQAGATCGTLVTPNGSREIVARCDPGKLSGFAKTVLGALRWPLLRCVQRNCSARNARRMRGGVLRRMQRRVRRDLPCALPGNMVRLGV